MNAPEKPFFNIEHPERLFEITALSFTRHEEFEAIEADFLLYPAMGGGFQMNYIRYEINNYTFERSGISNIFWNDSFNISDDNLKVLIDINAAIISVLEAAYQYWKINGENSKGHENVCLGLVPLNTKNESSANKIVEPIGGKSERSIISKRGCSAK